MTTPNSSTPDRLPEDDPLIRSLQNLTEVVVVAVALEAVVAMGERLSEDSWRQLAAADERPVLDYPPGYVPAPNGDMLGPIGALEDVAVLRLAQFRHQEHGDLTLLEYDAAAALTVTAIGAGAPSAAAAGIPMDGFDAASAALTSSGWSVVYLESGRTRLRGAVRAETARRRAAARAAAQHSQPKPSASG